MIYASNRRLYDITTRSQIVVESFKAWQVREFNDYAAELSAELKRIFSRLPYHQLSRLNRAQLAKLIASVRSVQDRIYNEYSRKLLKQLQDFANADLEMNRRVYASAFRQLEPEDTSGAPTDAQAVAILEEESANLYPLFGLAAVTTLPARFWSLLSGVPIAANGLTIERFLGQFSLSARASIENLIRKSWANAETVPQLIAQITGQGAQAAAGKLDVPIGTPQLAKIKIQNDAVVRTLVQFVHTQAQAGVLSSLFEYYVWNSVLDNRTTEICISRDNRIFKFGEGPIPPAHIRCRSHIAPLVGKTIQEMPDLPLWLKGEPMKLQKLLLRQAGADLLNSGKLRAKEFPQFINSQPLNLDQFKDQIGLILHR